MFLSACSGLEVPRGVVPGTYDTPTFARSASRINAVPCAIRPPLMLQWQQDLTAGIGNGSPVLVDSTLVIGNLRGELYGFNARTGKRYGWVTLGGSIEGTPVMDGDLAIVPLAGLRESLIGYDVVEGRTRWRAALGDIHASPLLIGSRVLVGNVAGTFFAVDRSTGEVQWRYALPGNTTLKGIRSSAAGTSDHVVFGADDGALYDLLPGTGTLHWRAVTDGAIQATPAIIDSTVIVGTLAGTIYALDLASGTVRWTYRSGAAVYAPPVIIAGRCILGTTGGEVLALNCTNGALLWSTPVHGPVNAGILATDSLLFVGTLHQELIALAASDGSILWRGTVSGRIKTTPIAGKDRIYVATDDRLVQAFAGSGQ